MEEEFSGTESDNTAEFSQDDWFDNVEVEAVEVDVSGRSYAGRSLPTGFVSSVLSRMLQLKTEFDEE